MSPVLLWGNVQNVSGTWQGTFARIDNEEAALMKAHTLYSNGKWYRIRSDEGRYRDAWVGAFRGYYTPIEQPSVGSLSAVFKLWVQGDDDDPITRFPSDLFVSDSNFSNYDTEGTGIELPSLAPAAEEEGERAGLQRSLWQIRLAFRQGKSCRRPERRYVDTLILQKR